MPICNLFLDINRSEKKVVMYLFTSSFPSNNNFVYDYNKKTLQTLFFFLHTFNYLIY